MTDIDFWKVLEENNCAIKTEVSDNDLPDTFEMDGKLYQYKYAMDPERLKLLLEIERSRNVQKLTRIVVICFVLNIIAALISIFL